MSVSDPYKVLQVLPNAEQEVIRAAFHALALKYHPDRDPSTRASRRMIELNQAYAMVRDAEARAQLERGQRGPAYDFSTRSAGRASAAPPGRGDKTSIQLETGRYAGWTLKDLGDHDPDYLRWLSRHSSGLRYRSEIARILGAKGFSAA